MNDFKPNVLLDVLLAEYVLKKDDNERFRLDHRWKSAERFDDYVVLYKIATVLLALLNAEQKNPNYCEVRLIFEKAIFTDGNIQKLFFYHEVKSAINKLGELIDATNYKFKDLDDQNNKIPWTMAGLRATGILSHDQAIVDCSAIWWGWATAWLREVGIIETNPVTLDLFSMMWIDNYVAINNCLNEWNPIV
jgi:hypothetical protein